MQPLTCKRIAIDSLLSTSLSSLSIKPTGISTSPISRIDNNVWCMIASYFSISDCASTNCSSISLKNRAEIYSWKTLAIRMGFSRDFIKKCGSVKNAIQYGLKEDVLAQRGFNFFASTDPNTGIISVRNKEGTSFDFNGIWQELQNGPLISMKNIQELKHLVESSDNREAATFLLITCKDLTRLPKDLMFPNLRGVSLIGLNLQHPIPDWIFLLPKLSQLSLKNMGMIMLPTAITHCINLKELNISNIAPGIPDSQGSPNCITELPVSLSHLPNLNSLSMNNLNLTSVPPNLFELPHLEILHLENNPLLGTLPDRFANLQKLTKLYISNIGLTEWPNALLELKGIQFLAIGNNNIKDIPESIRRWLFQLKTLHCFRNPWSQDALQILNSLKTESQGGCWINY